MLEKFVCLLLSLVVVLMFVVVMCVLVIAPLCLAILFDIPALLFLYFVTLPAIGGIGALLDDWY